MSRTEPKEVRYIKLDAGGGWSRPSLDQGEMHFGHRTVPLDMCLADDWDAAVQHLSGEGRTGTGWGKGDP